MRCIDLKSIFFLLSMIVIRAFIYLLVFVYIFTCYRLFVSSNHGFWFCSLRTLSERKRIHESALCFFHQQSSGNRALTEPQKLGPDSCFCTCFVVATAGSPSLRFLDAVEPFRAKCTSGLHSTSFFLLAGRLRPATCRPRSYPRMYGTGLELSIDGMCFSLSSMSVVLVPPHQSAGFLSVRGNNSLPLKHFLQNLNHSLAVLFFFFNSRIDVRIGISILFFFRSILFLVLNGGQ